MLRGRRTQGRWKRRRAGWGGDVSGSGGATDATGARTAPLGLGACTRASPVVFAGCGDVGPPGVVGVFGARTRSRRGTGGAERDAGRREPRRAAWSRPCGARGPHAGLSRGPLARCGTIGTLGSVCGAWRHVAQSVTDGRRKPAFAWEGGRVGGRLSLPLPSSAFFPFFTILTPGKLDQSGTELRSYG